MQGHFERILPKMTLQRFTKATLVNLYDLNLTKIWCCSVLIHAILYLDLALRPAWEVVTPDVLATNGVVHIIDHVLLGTLKLSVKDGICFGCCGMHVFTRFAPWGSIPSFCRSLAIRYAAWKTKAFGCEFAIACAFVVAALAFSLTVAPELWFDCSAFGFLSACKCYWI